MTSSVVMPTSTPLFILVGSGFTIIATVIKRRDKLYNKTTIEILDNYDVDIHY